MLEGEDFVVVGDDGVEVAYNVAGSGPPVLLIHGFPDDRSLWRVQRDALVDAGHMVITVDQRGFGASGKPPSWEMYQLKHAVADMVLVLDSSELRAVDVVGHDWGAATASLLAMFHPLRVARLVLLSAGHPGVFRTLGLEQRERAWYMQFFQAVDVAAEWLSADDWANFRMWGRHPDEDSVIRSLSAPGALRAALNWYRANSQPATLLPPKRNLPRIPHDTMGIWGADDDHLVEEFVTSTADFVDGNWRYERIDDGGHWLQIDQPTVLADLLVDFLGAAKT